MSEHLARDVVSWSGRRHRKDITDMAIAVQLDEIMADRRVSLNELSEKVGVTNVNLSRIKTGKVRSMRFSTLEKICESLECQPGDILKYVEPYPPRTN
ncbi:helix-turn-helix domain-containing protein [Alistipes putredinis]|uniref:helix-turn-helix domain-containing protein n=3 Tax=cellular organisms TaxID=131567 RepID=UPI003AB25B1E